MSGELLRELARVKAVFQLRTIEAIIRGPAQGIAAGTGATAQTGATEGKSPVATPCAQVIDSKPGSPQ